MKKRIASSVFPIVALLVAALPSFAIDPPSLIVKPPLLTLDPCFTADAEFSLSLPSGHDISSGSDFWVSVDTMDLLSGSTRVAKLLSNYRRVTLDGSHYVTMEHTIITGNMTIFAKASNTAAGYAGATGVVTDVLVGSRRQDVKLTYLITDFGGSRSICFFIIP